MRSIPIPNHEDHGFYPWGNWSSDIGCSPLVGVSLEPRALHVGLHRHGKAGNLYLARPKIDVPITISGIGRREIKPDGNIKIQVDARKWKLRDDWLPGRYRVTVRIDNLEVDEYSMLSVLTDPAEFEIK